MRTISRLIVLSFVLAVCSSQSRTSPAVPEYRQECIVWNNVTQILNHHRGTLMTCNKNRQCTGYDCSGIYQYQGMYTKEQEVHLNYCFGVAVHPCHSPVDLHFYVDMPDEKVHFQETVANTTDVRIPGLHYNMGELGTVDGYISVHMERVRVNGRRYAIIGMVFKIRAQGALSAIGEWPKSMQQTLMPLTEIPVPDCEKNVVTPPHNSTDCQRYSTVSPPPSTHSVPTTTHAPSEMTKPTTSSGSTASQQTPTTMTISSTKHSPPKGGKSCDTNTGYACPPTMRCSGNRCVCMSNFMDNGTACVPRHKTHMATTPIFIPEPDAQAIISDGSSSNKMPIIIGASVGCVGLVLGIIGGILLYKYRKHQLRYGNHQPLINNEDQDDDDDDPIDVST